MRYRGPGAIRTAPPAVPRGPRRQVMQKALAMWLLLAAAGGQPEASPTQVVQTATEQVVQVVQDTELAAPAGQERRAPGSAAHRRSALRFPGDGAPGAGASLARAHAAGAERVRDRVQAASRAPTWASSRITPVSRPYTWARPWTANSPPSARRSSPAGARRSRWTTGSIRSARGGWSTTSPCRA